VGRNKKVISIVTSAYNEELCISELIDQYSVLVANEPKYSFEFILVDNGSIDSTFEKLKLMAKRLEGRVEIIRLSRNFLDGGGLKAGLSRATGDALVLMSADLQDPPQFISKFLRFWEEGYKNVYAEIVDRNSANLLRRINSRIFYKLAYILSGKTMPQNVSDFRLIDRTVYENLRAAPEYNKFLRGFIAWSGFSSIGIRQERPKRFAGLSKAGTRDTINYAIKGILSNSSVPLRLVSLVNLCAFVVQVLYLIFELFVVGTKERLYQVLLGAVTTLTLTVISEYLIMMYQETKKRPQYIIQEIVTKKSKQFL
jgi:dolichol-phosphate mannosyltransferase